MQVTIEEIDLAQWEWAGEQDQEAGFWSYDDIQLVVDRVNRGAQLLDEQEPGWMDRVFPDKVNMRDGQFCIIGQVYGAYDEYVGVPFGLGQTMKGTTRKAVDHGFLTQCKAPNEQVFENIPYELLDAVWVSLIRERAKTGKNVFLDVPPQLPRNRMINLVSRLVEV